TARRLQSLPACLSFRHRRSRAARRAPPWYRPPRRRENTPRRRAPRAAPRRSSRRLKIQRSRWSRGARSAAARWFQRVAAASSYVTSPDLAEHLEYANIGCRMVLAQLLAKRYRPVLIERLDQQRSGDFLVTAAQLLFLRHRHAGGIERDPDFTAGDRRVGRKPLHRGRQPGFV